MKYMTNSDRTIPRFIRAAKEKYGISDYERKRMVFDFMGFAQLVTPVFFYFYGVLCIIFIYILK